MHFDKVLPYKKADPATFDEEEQVAYRNYTREFYENFAPDSWKSVLQKTLLYKKPHLVNALDTRDDFYHKLFMHPTMFKVGRHDFVIRAPMEQYDKASGLFKPNENFFGEPDYFYYSNVSPTLYTKTC